MGGWGYVVWVGGYVGGGGTLGDVYVGGGGGTLGGWAYVRGYVVGWGQGCSKINF